MSNVYLQPRADRLGMFAKATGLIMNAERHQADMEKHEEWRDSADDRARASTLALQHAERQELINQQMYEQNLEDQEIGDQLVIEANEFYRTSYKDLESKYAEVNVMPVMTPEERRAKAIAMNGFFSLWNTSNGSALLQKAAMNPYASKRINTGFRDLGGEMRNQLQSDSAMSAMIKNFDIEIKQKELKENATTQQENLNELDNLLEGLDAGEQAQAFGSSREYTQENIFTEFADLINQERGYAQGAASREGWTPFQWSTAEVASASMEYAENILRDGYVYVRRPGFDGKVPLANVRAGDDIYHRGKMFGLLKAPGLPGSPVDYDANELIHEQAMQLVKKATMARYSLANKAVYDKPYDNPVVQMEGILFNKTAPFMDEAEFDLHGKNRAANRKAYLIREQNEKIDQRQKEINASLTGSVTQELDLPPGM